MQRFHIERFIMVKRWRAEWEIHGRDFGDCHCGLGMGTMRKHRPRESHPSSSCRLCGLERYWARQARRRARHGARALINEGLGEVPSMLEQHAPSNWGWRDGPCERKRDALESS